MPVLQAARRTHKVVGTHRVRCFRDGIHHLGLPCPDAKHEPHPDRVESLLGTSECVVSPPSFSMSEPITKKMSFPGSNELSLLSPYLVKAQIQIPFFGFCRTPPHGLTEVSSQIALTEQRFKHRVLTCDGVCINLQAREQINVKRRHPANPMLARAAAGSAHLG